MTPFHYLILAFGSVFFLLGLYLLVLGRRVSRLQSMLQEMRRRVEED
jgi:CcmD family protein